uniref:Putative tail protein n=1 Tax=viral metagenome TaxID=1070528 RepID=A0A6H1ZPI1_9ZZZZ
MIEYSVDTAGARARIDEVVKRAENMEKALNVIGRMAVSEVKLNFIEGGRVPVGWENPTGKYVDPGKWTPLTQYTLDHRRKEGRGAKILIDTAVLMGSISYRIEGETLLVGTVIKYGRDHQFGTHRVPPRPFITFLPETMDEFRVIAARYIIDGESA